MGIIAHTFPVTINYFPKKKEVITLMQNFTKTIKIVYLNKNHKWESTNIA